MGFSQGEFRPMSPGGPLLKGELMVRRVLEGLKQISDSGLLGCLSI